MMKRRRLNKKTNIKKGSVSVPLDIVIEIVSRLPVKVVAKFLLVSKLWSSIIRRTDFIRSFPSIQHQPPRLLFALNTLNYQSGRHHWFFYLHKEETHTISLLPRVECPIPNRRICDVHYVNGLISLGYGRQQIITNPSIGKSIYLPKVNSRKHIIQSFFGYDPINAEYKALCMSEGINDYTNVPSSEHQVFTLGGLGSSWRSIECNIPHCPKTNGLCINGVLYYGAFTGTDMMEWGLIRFDVRTEKFDLIAGLNEISVKSLRPSLINYQGKVTFAFEPLPFLFELWILEDGKCLKKWSKICFSLLSRMHLYGDALRIRGTIHTGEIIFVPYNVNADSTLVIYYDHKKRMIWNRSFSFKNQVSMSPLMVVPFFNYVESAMLL